MKPHFGNLGGRLRALRRNTDLSQQKFADRCQLLGLPVTRDMVASWETNRAEMPSRLIPFIAYILNAEVPDLLPDLRASEFTNPPRISTAVAASAKHPQTPKPKAQAPNSVGQLARIISETAKTARHARPVKSVFLAENETSPLGALILPETRVKLMALIRTLDHRHRQVLLAHGHF